ncbi:pirin family protein [Coraliomargarita akajimensis]|uniref:Pirin domain protein n=1 Tax=Coraliomargarita akajimensis (strain DSM 45221 / IAM 15411 / JCM 23193 / KCTC 12865 / 04OKA010-24) TaxID=583355 RepID=D5EQG9_CORAD|nr:pirin family protein [Coraliomargarita akajimensis]ADE55783.1 Pirin domain protein [Coraliomargarita akajimensis DSM 45221]
MKTQIRVTRAAERMRSKWDWLDSYHSFSFGEHYDPTRMGFGSLRVVNDDIIGPGGGFPMHPHRDMEIVSLVLKGELEHADSMGNGRVIQAGDIQYMGAGTGVRHSEFNPSSTEPTHLLQIWLQPGSKGLEPQYADQQIHGREANQWKLLLSSDGREGSMKIRQDALLYSVELEANHSIEHVTAARRGLWLFVIEGAVDVEGATLGAGDSLEVSGVDSLALLNSAEQTAKVILFDLAL